MKVLIVGDEPSKQTDPKVTFKGAACEKRLMQWIKDLGITEYELINRTHPDFDLIRFRYRWGWNMPIIALGNNASKALGPYYDHFKLPHPSGRNRKINNKQYLVSILNECRLYLRTFVENNDNCLDR